MQELQILVRYGWQPTIGKFRLPEAEANQRPVSLGNTFQRGEMVVIQSPRGLEAGEVLSACQPDENPMGAVVRRCSTEDQILRDQLRRFSSLAHTRCTDWMLETGIEATLLEVEPLLDGQTLYFHFLSGVDGLVQKQVEMLAQLYESEVATSDFAHKLATGCGPGCGTESAMNRGCSSCTNCRICVTKR